MWFFKPDSPECSSHHLFITGVRQSHHVGVKSMIGMQESLHYGALFTVQLPACEFSEKLSLFQVQRDSGVREIEKARI